jgi:hypothetical protein
MCVSVAPSFPLLSTKATRLISSNLSGHRLTTNFRHNPAQPHKPMTLMMFIVIFQISFINTRVPQNSIAFLLRVPSDLRLTFLRGGERTRSTTLLLHTWLVISLQSLQQVPLLSEYFRLVGTCCHIVVPRCARTQSLNACVLKIGFLAD